MSGEDETIGGVTWHVSEEDGPPDVGLSLFLGPDDRLYCGEISRDLFERTGGPEHFDSDGGWFLVRFNPEPHLIAKLAAQEDAQEFIEQIGHWVREANLPTLAHTLGERARERANERDASS